MTRKLYIILLLFLSWVITNLHRLWNNSPVVFTNPFPLDKEYQLTWHWYIYSILDAISTAIIFFSLWLYINSNMKKDKDVLRTFGAIFANYLIDIVHYVLCARHNELILSIEGLIIVWAAYKLFVKRLRKPLCHG